MSSWSLLAPVTSVTKMRILGVDPGLRKTGFGVIEVQGQHLQYIASGTIVVPTDEPLALRLRVILQHLREIVENHQPDLSAVEQVFVNTNPHSTLLLGQARGAALCALADSGLEVHEYTALQIKKTVVGRGHATKEQIQHMVQYLLRLNGTPAPDAADALACALCHAHHAPLQQQLIKQNTLSTTQLRTRGGRYIGK